ncbi:hypothetical protein LOCC1_G008540 [Lachnellula occidentalis]|uniref:CENP-V/GFA domain-containing protein n=1 Tax=Lachnellula occidentalis TaxID=215460 RepID=A0A8H8U7D1_9HELO|nr:hypothetical protein LOCC1_G008540 [Lachnellula occidentalis]
MTTTTITATCACNAFTYAVSFPPSSLPRPHALCLCTSCRRLTGSCGTSYITLPATHSIEPANYTLTSYNTSDQLTRYFCSTCGAHVLSYRLESKTWALTTGTWDHTEGVVGWSGCKWVADTLDGGVSVWLRDIGEAGVDGTKRPSKRWLLADEEQSRHGELVPDGTLETLPSDKKRNADKLKAQCHCGGVKFYITRPDAASKAVRAPLPDLMAASHSHSPANPENQTWWLRSNDTKYLAGHCTCTSCRLSSGCEIQPWAFVPDCNIFQEDGRPLDFNMGTLKRYDSSKNVFRDFCGLCGATVFWHSTERPGLMDISVGLLDPEEGARVESWLEWRTARVSFEELAVSRSLVASLEDGLKSWKQN